MNVAPGMKSEVVVKPGVERTWARVVVRRERRAVVKVRLRRYILADMEGIRDLCGVVEDVKLCWIVVSN